MNAQDLAGLSDEKLNFIVQNGDESGQLVPLARQVLSERTKVQTIAPTGERAAKLKKDIADSQSPLPGGQWAQPIDAALRYAGIIGGEGNESTLGAIAHQANAGAASILSNVPGLMQGAEAIGDLSDALVPGQDKRYNVFPRSGGTNQLINTAPSPLLAHAAGITPWAAPANAAGMVPEVARAVTAPVQKVAQAMPVANRLPGTVLPSVATQVGLNTAINSAATAGKVAAGQPADFVEDVVKPSLAPESLLPAAAVGSFPAPRGSGSGDAELVASIRRRNGGQIPAELKQPMSTFDSKATEQRRSFADKFAQARQAAGDAWKARQAKQTDINKSSIDEAKKSADEAIATAAAEQELPARELYTQEKEAWSGKAGQGGEYRKKLGELLAQGTRVEPDTRSLDKLFDKYKSTSEPVTETETKMVESPILDESGNKVSREEEIPIEGKDDGRPMSLGRAIGSLVSSVKSHLGKNPSLREYQNALAEADAAVETKKATPRAKQAFTEIAAALRADAYNKFPGFQDLSTSNKIQMERQETANQALFGKDDPRIGEGTSDANRFAGDTAPGEPVKVPMNATTKANRWLAGEGEDPSTAHTYKAFRGLGEGYQRILDTVQAVKDQARGYVRDVEGRAKATSSDLESRAQRSQRNIKATQTEKQRQLDDSLDRTREEMHAVDKSKFPSLLELAPSVGLLAGSQMYHGPHSLATLAMGTALGARKLAPYVRAQAAYHTPDALRLDPQFARSNVLPAVSGPLAFEGSNPFDIGTSEQTAPVNSYLRRREEEKSKALEELVTKLVKAGKSEEEARRAAEAAFQ